MNKTARRIAVGFAATAAAVATGFQFQRWFSENPEYEVLRDAGGLEVRRYAPRVVASTIVTGGRNDGFRVLAGYIFGGNTRNQSIAMTSPVMTEPAAGERIAMTSPVETQQVEGGTRMQFVMPSEYALADLPTPNDPRVQLEEIDAQVVAVLKFRGRFDRGEFDAKIQRALRLADEAGLELVGPPRVAQYDPPWTLGWFRRNEVMLPLES